MHTAAKYLINILAFCGMQVAVTIFSIFAVSLIRQETPNHMIGKVMAYTSAITMCVQPLGQMTYGFLFDLFSHAVSVILIPTGIIVYIIGVSATGFFEKLEMKQGAWEK